MTAPPDQRGLPRWLAITWPVLCAAMALLANGYRFGTSDQSIHLTLLRELLDPGALAGDLVADHAASHASLWWHLQVPLLRVLGWESLPVLYLALYVVALVATFALLGRLAGTLLHDPRAALVAPLLLVVFKACPAHVHTFEPELLNRTAVHPLLLGAVWLVLRGRAIPAAALCGLAFDLHATTALHTAMALSMAIAFDGRLRADALRAVGAFAVCAAPLWILIAMRGGPADWWIDAEWMHVLRWRMPHHLFPDRWPAAVWVAAVFQLTLWIVASRWVLDPVVRRRAHLLVGGVLVCGPVLGTLVAGPLPVAPVLALHPWESWILLAVLAYLAAAGPLVAALCSRSGAVRLTAVAVGIVLALGFESGTMGLRRTPTFAWRGPTGSEGTLVEALAGPRFRISAGSYLLVPPTGMTWLRAWTGRPLFTSAKDGGEAVFDREMALSWRFRMAELCGEDILEGPPPGDEWLGYRSVAERARKAFDRQTDGDLRRLAGHHRAWLLVVPIDGERPASTPIHVNDGYFVYDLRHVPSHRGSSP